MEIRLLTPEERPLAASLWQYCFADPQPFADWYFARRAGDVLAMPEGDDLAAQIVCTPVSMAVRGTARAASILSGVATAATYRRQGRMTTLVREGLHYLRGQGVAIAALYPFDYGFYRQYGFAACGEVARVKTRLRDLPTAKPSGDVLLTRDAGLLAQAYEAGQARYSGHILRDEAAMALRLEELALDDGYAAVYRRGGALEGYLLYHMADKTLFVDEIGAARDVARRDLLSFLANHASTMDAVQFLCALEDPLWRMLPDPRGCVTAEPYDMLRIVDIPAAMDGLPAPAGNVTLRVRDAHAPWNEGTWRFASEGGALRAEKTEDASAPEISIEELTQWALGCGDGPLLPKQDVFLYEMY